jgi:rhodanese-related sulfurtransferase
MSKIQKYIIALAALFLLGCEPAADQFIEVKAAAVKQASGELLLDIREADDYKEFHIPNSTNIPFGRLKLRLAELDAYKGKPIMVIDHAGMRAPWAWDVLNKAGFSSVFIVKGGVAEWKSAGLPIETLDMQVPPQPEPQPQAEPPLQAEPELVSPQQVELQPQPQSAPQAQ